MKKPKYKIGDVVIAHFDDHVYDCHDPIRRIEVKAHTIQAKIVSAEWEGGGWKNEWVYMLDSGRTKYFPEGTLDGWSK